MKTPIEQKPPKFGHGTHFFAVGIGGAIGGGLRHALTLIPGVTYSGMILTINTLGAFLLPLIALYLLDHFKAQPRTRLLVTTGAISSFTTFSALTGEMVERFEAGHIGSAGGYLLITLITGLVAAGAGYYLAQRCAGPTQRAPTQRAEQA